MISNGIHCWAVAFQCHPGERTKCLRGPMYNAGILCQDCHGSMGQVGNDFSADVSIDNPGAFVLADDFYTNPDTPRVPWANEPTCQSCHTGDALSNLAGDDKNHRRRGRHPSVAGLPDR